MSSLFTRITLYLGLLFGALLPLQFGLAQDFKLNDTYANHLTEINAEWNNYENAIPTGKISFMSDADRIQLHLQLVVEHLTANLPVNATKSQKENRLSLLHALKEYAENKIFPRNKYHLTRTPYFVDENNVYCAVGYLMAYSGYTDLVAAIREEHNYDYIKDIRTAGVSEWASVHGLTVDELKWIQPSYPPTETLEPISNGTNGTVSGIYYDGTYHRLFFAGAFDSVNLLPCLNIGIYQNNQLSCLGNGIAGTINHVKSRANGVMVFGAFESNGEIFPIADFSNGTWTYMGIPNRQNATCTAAYNGSSNYKFEIAISHSSIPNKQEIWYLSNQDIWEKKAMVTGEILAIEASPYGRIYAGHFDTTFVYDAFGTIDSTFTSNNVTIKTNYSNTWFSLGDEISDTVHAIQVIGNNIYFAGSCSNSISQSDVFLSRYLNSTLQPLLLRSDFSPFTNISINSLAFDNSTSELILGGHFETNAFMSYGNNLAKYNFVYGYLTPMALLNAPVHSILFYNNSLYLGGEFTLNLNNQSLHHLAKVSNTSDVNELQTMNTVVVSPNPFMNEIKVSGVEPESKYELLNVSGQQIRSGHLENNRVGSLQDLPEGVYFLKVTNGLQETTCRIIK